MTRLPDWRARLNLYLASATGADCALWAAGAVEAMTGIDPAAKYRGAYTTLDEGLALLKADGFKDHVAWLRANFKRVKPVDARPGDLVVIDTDTLRALGIVQGASLYVLTPNGPGTIPRSRARFAFKV